MKAANWVGLCIACALCTLALASGLLLRRAEAQAPLCGNGQIDGDESCDDGNTLDGDGCDTTCAQSTACSFAHTGMQRYVGGCGAPSHPDIQAAIDAADDGDFITVCPGTYTAPVVVTREVRIQATPGTVTVHTTGVAFDIRRSGVHVEGLTIRSDSAAAISADQICPLGQPSCAAPGRGSNVSIVNNTIESSVLGIGWQRRIDCAAITGNELAENATHIELAQQEGPPAALVTIIVNRITGGGLSGAAVRLSGLGVTFAANRVEGSNGAGVTLADMPGGGAARLVENTIDGSSGDGITVLPGANSTEIRDNNITNNETGVGNDSAGTVDARENWWGSETGPSGAFTGVGNGIVNRTPGAVTLFVEYLCAPFPHGFPSVLGVCASERAGLRQLVPGRAPDIDQSGRYIVFESTADLDVDPRTLTSNADGSIEVFILERQATSGVCVGGASSCNFAAQTCSSCTGAEECSGTPGADPIVLDGECAMVTQISDGMAPHESASPRLSENGDAAVFASTGNPTGANPDGSREIFTWSRSAFEQNHPALTMRSSGVGSDSYDNPVLSLTGAYIVVESDANPTGQNPDGNVELFLHDTGTPQWTQLTDTAPTWITNHRSTTVDGEYVLFDSTGDFTGQNVDGNRELFLVRKSERLFTQITNTFAPADNYSGSLDGQSTVVAFSSTGNFTGQNSDGNREIFTWNRNTGHFEQLTNSVSGESGNPVITQSGAFVVFDSTADLQQTGATNRRVFQYNRVSGELTLLSGSRFGTNQRPRTTERFVVWEATSNLTGDNPSGDWVIYLLDRAPRPALTASTTTLTVGRAVTLGCDLGTFGAGATVAFFVTQGATIVDSQQLTATGSGIATWTRVVPAAWVPGVAVQCRADSKPGQPTSDFTALVVNPSSSCVSTCSNGVACTAPGQCQSGFCVDGVCCGSESCPAGKVCNVPGQEGQCQLQSSTCDNDGVKDPGEECDGSDHGGRRCADFRGFDCGSLTCVDCRLDTSDCRRSECEADRCSADGTTLEQCVQQLNGCRVVFREPCLQGCFGDRCTTAIYLDWDTPLDVAVAWTLDDTTGDCAVTAPTGSMEIAGFLDHDKAAIKTALKAILDKSGMAIPVIDSGTMPSNVVHVRFSSAIPSPSGRNCGKLLGVAYDGYNQCNIRRRNRVAVFGTPGEDMKLVAETAAHEAAHALGLRHVNPYPNDSIEVMDYEGGPQIERFTAIRTEVREPPEALCSDGRTRCHSDTDCTPATRPCVNGSVETFLWRDLEVPQTHNPAFHLRAFTFRRSAVALRSEGLQPGTWDSHCYGRPSSPYVARIASLSLTASLELHDVHAWLQLTRVPVKSDGAREDPNWSPLKYIGDVSDASQIEVVWNRSLPLRIAGSSTKNGSINVVFGLGDAADPQLAFPTSTSGVIQGSIFHFPTPGGAPTVVGSFTGLVAPAACGNGVLDAGEECDDGNATAGDECEPSCTLTECPCSGPPAGGVWKSHGAYRACVAQTTKALPYAGILTRQQRREILRAAARSTCGQPEKTRCCIPTKKSAKCKIRFPDQCTVKGGIDIGVGSCIPDWCG